MSWITQAKMVAFAEVAERLGMKPKGKRWGPCPACSASRGKKDPRPPVHNYQGQAWVCNACMAGGDTVDLVAFQFVGVRVRECQDYSQIISFFGSQQSFTPTVDYRDEEMTYPPIEEVMWIFKNAHNLAEYSNQNVDEYLSKRAIDPSLVTEAWIAPTTLDYGRLTYVTSSSGKRMPWFPTQWATEYPIIQPLFDYQGQCRSMHARTIIENQTPKNRCPIGYTTRNLILANKAAREFLRGEAEHKTFWIVEGETDFLSLDQRLPSNTPCIGIKSGSINAFSKINWPADSKIIICTDPDKAGEHYAEMIARAIYPIHPQRLIIRNQQQ